MTNVLVTRPKHQADGLCDLIEQQGWNAIRFPTLEIVGIDDDLLRQQLKRIDHYQWLIFISANAVNFALSLNNGRIGCFELPAIAAVGKATEKALHSEGVVVDLLPEQGFNTEGLLATNEMKQVKGKSCLIVRGQGGRETLAQVLRERGANVDYLEVYKRKIPEYNAGKVINLLKQGKLDAITITSGDGLMNLLTMIDDELHAKLLTIPLIVISHRIKALSEKFQFTQIVVTGKHGDAAIIDAVRVSL